MILPTKKPQSAVEFEIQVKNTDTGEGGDGDNCMQVLKVALSAFFFLLLRFIFWLTEQKLFQLGFSRTPRQVELSLIRVFSTPIALIM